MNIRSRRSINIFTGRPSGISRAILNPVQLLSTKINPVITPDTNKLTPLQYDQLLQIEAIYTSKLSNKNYVDIPSNLAEYVKLSNGIQGMDLVDYKNSTYQLLLTIGTESLIGSLQMYSIYQKSIVDELKLIKLNSDLDNILTKVNEIGIMKEVSGQFNAVKSFNLAPVYSNYITLYGLPAYGVGFDLNKLAFIASLNNLSL